MKQAVKHSFLLLSQSFEQDGRRDGGRQIQKVRDAFIGALSKRHNSSVLVAVVEVKVEIPGDPSSVGEHQSACVFVSREHE